jgi:hypothetical protein
MAKGATVKKSDDSRPSAEQTNENQMVDWANKFFKKYGYDLDVPPSSSKADSTKFILQDANGVQPRMFDKVTHDKFEQELMDLIASRNKIPKNNLSEIKKLDEKIVLARKNMGTSLQDYLADVELLRMKCDEAYIGGTGIGKQEASASTKKIPYRLAVIFCQFDNSSVQGKAGEVAETFGTGGRSISICSNTWNSCNPFVVIHIGVCTIGTLAHEMAHAGALMSDIPGEPKTANTFSIMNYDNLLKASNPHKIKLESSLNDDSEVACKARLKTAFFVT